MQDVALTAAENLMTANPDMTALYATGEPALIGAVSAVSSQKMTDKVKVFGWDLTAQAMKGIDEGWIVAVVQQDPYQEGDAAVETIIKLKKGEKVPASIDIPVTIVTKDECRQVPRHVQIILRKPEARFRLRLCTRGMVNDFGPMLIEGAPVRVRMEHITQALRHRPVARRRQPRAAGPARCSAWSATMAPASRP